MERKIFGKKKCLESDFSGNSLQYLCVTEIENFKLEVDGFEEKEQEGNSSLELDFNTLMTDLGHVEA